MRNLKVFRGYLLPLSGLLLLAASCAQISPGYGHLEAGNDAAARGQWDRAIALYSRAIESRDLSQANLAVAFNNRGLAYARKGQLDRAIDDYDTAIRLKADYAEAYYDRGLAYYDQGRYDRALKDLDSAARLNPKSVVPLVARGYARFYLGKYRDAARDFALALERNPEGPYPALWLYLARARAGEDGRKELASNARRLDLDKWPGKVAALYLGKTKPASLLASAKDPDPRRERAKRCQAYFYLGQQALIGKNRAEAKKLFRQAVETGATESAEYQGAKEELKRLSR